MFFVNKQKKVEQLIEEYCLSVLECMDAFKQAIQLYCKDMNREQAKESFEKVHKAESRADDIRNEIEVMMYERTLFPESRGDILVLLETMDKVPNQAESVVRMIWNQHVNIPEQFRPQILQLVDICSRAVDATVEAIRKIFTDYTNATVAVGKIDELESKTDHVEAFLIEQLFAKPIGPLETIVLRDLIKNIGHISDRAENVGDRIRIIVAKRSL